MEEVLISIWVRIAISLIVVILYIITFFILLGLIKRTKGKVVRTYKYFTIMIVALVSLRVFDILENADILFIPYSHEVLVLIFSLLLFLGAVHYYKCLKEITDV